MLFTLRRSLVKSLSDRSLIESQISSSFSLDIMIDFQKQFDRLQKALGEEYAPGKNCVDKIDEQIWWNKIMKELNEISLESANELQKETGKPYPKDSNVLIPIKTKEEIEQRTGESYDEVFRGSNGNIIVARKNLKYSEAPPTRILALNLILTYWLGWLDAKGGHALDTETVAAWRRIQEKNTTLGVY